MTSPSPWKIGENVPWNAAWTGEAEYAIRPCRWAGNKPAVWSPHRPGQGRPEFAKPHMVRQRRSIVQFRCTVCGECTATDDRWWFALGSKDVRPYAFVTVEAPVHRACADRALRMCPHLRQLGQSPLRFPPPDCTIAAIVSGPKTAADFGLPLEGARAVGHLKFAWLRLPFRESPRTEI